MTVNINTQRVASVARQILAIAAITFGVLTQSDSSLHLPVLISSILTVAGSVIIAIEHYVGDPSTGTPAVTPPQAVPSLPPTNPPASVG